MQGDPWEPREIVLDEDSLPLAESKVTIGPGGVLLRDFFLEQLKHTLAEAAKTKDPVLVLIFAHGDFEQPSGLYIGTSFDNPGTLLTPTDVAHVHGEYSDVPLTLYMTSCYSGHWVESKEFKAKNRAVLAAGEHDQESFAFVWPHSQRHAGGLFTEASLQDLLQEPIEMPKDTDKDLSRTYKAVTTAIISDMHKLCLPENISDYGSMPVFSDKASEEKLWRTGFRLHNYRLNYDRLKKIPVSDPHPKRDRKRFVDGFVDDCHPDVVAWQQCPEVLDEDHPDMTAGYGSTRRGIGSKHNMKYLISKYMQSQKGSARYYESKVAMNRIRFYMKGKMDVAHQQELRTVLISRLFLNDLTCQYTRALELYKLPPFKQ